MKEIKVEARYSQQRDDGTCLCVLCPRRCAIARGGQGFCGHRRNEDGTLIAGGYGQVAALAVDPIEKKPLYHFYPGSKIASVGANGCNLACKFCQNWHLAEGRARSEWMAPAELAAQARAEGSVGLAFTYNEPTIWFEYILDTVELLKPRGLKAVLVTNGYLEAEPWDELCGVIDAANIDVKGDDDFYRTMTGGRLAPVRRNVEVAVRAGVHVEVTNLLVTGVNDGAEQVRELVDWLAGVSPLTPLHLSRYFPQHKYDAPATPMERLTEALQIARAKLHYVYVGNVAIEGGGATRCHHCGHEAIARRGYLTRVTGLGPGGVCGACGGDLPIIID
jgi:pyruvate formate lyase activating enzyme